MGVIDLSAYKPAPATLGDANQVANGFQAIQNLLNGNVDNLNFGAGKIFDPTKLMQNAAIDRQGLAWDAASSTWKPVGGPVYRKTTVKQVINSAAETDLLNGEITIAANLMGANGTIRLTAYGDWLNNTGGVQSSPSFRLTLGGATFIQTPFMAGFWSASAARQGWKLVAEIQNAGVTNAQTVSFLLLGFAVNGVGPGLTNFTTGFGSTFVAAAASGFGTYESLGDNIGLAVDTTAAKALTFTVAMNAANANMDVTLRGALVELM